VPLADFAARLGLALALFFSPPSSSEAATILAERLWADDLVRDFGHLDHEIDDLIFEQRSPKPVRRFRVLLEILENPALLTREAARLRHTSPASTHRR